MDKQKGIALLSTLIFIALISLIVFYELQASLLQQRVSQNHYVQQVNFQMAQAGLSEAEKTMLAGGANCQLSTHSTQWFLQQSDIWWRSAKTCKAHAQGGSFQFVVIPLAINACLYWHGRPVQYVQIIDHAGKQDAVVLSAIYLKPVAQLLHCDSVIRYAKKARIAWESLS